MGKICVIHAKKHDLFIVHCCMDYNNVLNRVRNFHEEKLPRSFSLYIQVVPYPVLVQQSVVPHGCSFWQSSH